MAIVLVTGLPGHGKTLYTLAKYKAVHEPPPKGETRQVFHCQGEKDPARRGELKGIPGLVLPWTPWHPAKWEDLAPGSLLIVDEAQFVFPVRPGRGEPPDWIGALATHRHEGVDIVIITQHPSLIDTFVRRLVDQHFHVVRKFGTKFATVHEFPTGVRENPDKSRKDSIRHDWRYPKAVFDLYKSAEVHTVKARLPARLWVGIGAVVVALGASWMLVQRLASKTDAPTEAASGKPAAKRGSEPAGAAPGVQRVPGTPGGVRDGAQWVSNFAPRVAGLPHTAPAFDELTKPQEAPYPAYCVSLGPAYPCKCYTQRGTGLAVPRATCESIAKDGFFAYWTQDRAQKREWGGAESSSGSRPPEPAQQPQQGPTAALGAPNGG